MKIWLALIAKSAPKNILRKAFALNADITKKRTDKMKYIRFGRAKITWEQFESIVFVALTSSMDHTCNYGECTEAVISKFKNIFIIRGKKK